MKLKNSLDHRKGEDLSAFVDGEIPERELKQWIAALSSDQETRSRFSRYRLIGAQLSDKDDRIIDASPVADHVSRLLEDEPTVLAPRARHKTVHLPRLALGAALAAGVAVVAVSVAPQLVETPGSAQLAAAPRFAFAPRLSVPADGITMVALTPGTQHVKHGTPALAKGQRWKVLSPAMRQKLSRYLLEHNEMAGQISAQQPSAHLSYISAHNARP